MRARCLGLPGIREYTFHLSLRATLLSTRTHPNTHTRHRAVATAEPNRNNNTASDSFIEKWKQIDFHSPTRKHAHAHTLAVALSMRMRSFNNSAHFPHTPQTMLHVLNRSRINAKINMYIFRIGSTVPFPESVENILGNGHERHNAGVLLCRMYRSDSPTYSNPHPSHPSRPHRRHILRTCARIHRVRVGCTLMCTYSSRPSVMVRYTEYPTRVSRGRPIHHFHSTDMNASARCAQASRRADCRTAPGAEIRLAVAFAGAPV